MRFRSSPAFARVAPRLLGAVLAGSAAMAMGCEVPSVQFDSVDASEDSVSSGLLPGDLAESGAVTAMDATPAPDAGNTADAPIEEDASTSDASSDAEADADANANGTDAPAQAPEDAATDAASGPAPEASAPASTCPGVVPAGAATCCGDVACVAPNAKKCAEACATCEKSCAGATCCLHPNGSFAGCRASPADCP